MRSLLENTSLRLLLLAGLLELPLTSALGHEGHHAECNETAVNALKADIQATGEGEAQASYMVIKGDARYVVSQDYDTLLFGAPTLVRNLTVSGKRKIRGRQITVSPERIVLADFLGGLKISREQLIQIGILVGTDFNAGVEGVGAKTGLKLVLKGEFESKLKEKMPDFDPAPVIDMFLHPPVTDDYALAAGHPDPEGIRKMLCDGYDFSEERVNKAMEGFSVKAGQKTLESWF